VLLVPLFDAPVPELPMFEVALLVDCEPVEDEVSEVEVDGFGDCVPTGLPVLLPLVLLMLVLPCDCVSVDGLVVCATAMPPAATRQAVAAAVNRMVNLFM
jgi:hypothetical protein